MKIRISISLLALLAMMNIIGFLSIPAVQAQGINNKVAANTKEFDINLFEQNIRKALDGKSVGYAYAINHNGQLKKEGAGGYAVLEQDMPKDGIILDPKGIKQTARKRMNIASVSKTITATTVLKILQDKLAKDFPTLTIESKVNPFLPASWKRGPGVADLTFKELLSQFSGMNLEGGTDIAGLKTWIATGVTRPKSQYKYKNSNLAIFRIIIPYMLATSQIRKTFDAHAQANPDSFNALLSDQYKAAVNNLVLQPMGILNANCKLEGDFLPTRFYSFFDMKKSGTETGDWTAVSGGGGWYLSAVNLAQFLAHLRYNNKILTSATRKLMNDNYLGWMSPEGWPQVVGDFGVYHSHEGDLFYGSEPRNGMTSIIMNYPNGVQVAILVNSLGTYTKAVSLAKETFDNSWVLPKP